MPCDALVGHAMDMTTPADQSVMLSERLSAFRAELDPVLERLNELRASCPKVADRQLRDIYEQLTRAVYHLELALDYLMPLGDREDRPLPLRSDF